MTLQDQIHSLTLQERIYTLKAQQCEYAKVACISEAHGRLRDADHALDASVNLGQLITHTEYLLHLHEYEMKDREHAS